MQIKLSNVLRRLDFIAFMPFVSLCLEAAEYVSPFPQTILSADPIASCKAMALAGFIANATSGHCVTKCILVTRCSSCQV